jgi:hypothetical protein
LRTSFKYILFISIFAALGFSREFVFVNLNNRLYSLFYKHNDYILPNSLSFFNQFDYDTLYYIKYPFTIFYFLAYFLTSFFAIKLICLHKKNALWVVYIYALLLVLSGISMTYNYLINNQFGGDGYTFSRWLMGIAQSPLVTFFIIASSKLYTKFQPQL